MARDDGTVLIENAELIYLNFTGRQTRFNDPGKRNFSVFIDDPKVVQALERDGWNVKYTNVVDDGDIARAFLPVEVRYDILPPKVYMITSRGRTLMNEETIPLLDSSDIIMADLTVRPRDWSDPGQPPKIKAYLKSMFVTVEEDYLDQKYADVPLAGAAVSSSEE